MDRPPQRENLPTTTEEVGTPGLVLDKCGVRREIGVLCEVLLDVTRLGPGTGVRREPLGVCALLELYARKESHNFSYSALYNLYKFHWIPLGRSSIVFYIMVHCFFSIVLCVHCFLNQSRELFRELRGDPNLRAWSRLSFKQVRLNIAANMFMQSSL